MILPRSLFFFLLSSSLTIGCGNNDPNTPLAKEQTIEDTPSTEVVIRNNSQATGTFSELPPLAQFVNEIGLQMEYLEPTDALPLVLDNAKVSLNEDSFDHLHLDFLNAQNIQITFSERGTSGGVVEEQYFHLIEQESPIVVVLSTSMNCTYLGNWYFSGIRNRMEELMEEEGLDEATADYISAKEAERDLMTDLISLVGSDVDDVAFDISIYQKKQGAWEDITATVLDLKSIQNISQHYPFLVGTGAGQRASFEEKFAHASFYNNNKEKLQAAFGNSDWESYGMGFDFDGDDILITITKDKAIRFQWDGTSYAPKDWTTTDGWLTEPCTKVDFKTAGSYRFKGKIADKHAIEMEINCNPKGESLAFSGHYWYSKNPSSKMPIEGSFSSDLNKEVSFYRIKNGENRESFDCYFSSCRFEGYWQHFGNLNIDKFYLEMID